MSGSQRAQGLEGHAGTPILVWRSEELYRRHADAEVLKRQGTWGQRTAEGGDLEPAGDKVQVPGSRRGSSFQETRRSLAEPKHGAGERDETQDCATPVTPAARGRAVLEGLYLGDQHVCGGRRAPERDITTKVRKRSVGSE